MYFYQDIINQSFAPIGIPMAANSQSFSSAGIPAVETNQSMISTMYFYQNCWSVYNFWCLLPSRLSNHMALDNTQADSISLNFALRDRKTGITVLRSPPCIFIKTVGVCIISGAYCHPDLQITWH